MIERVSILAGGTDLTSKWIKKGNQIIEEAMKLPAREALKILANHLMNQDTSKSKAETISKILKEKIRQLMLILKIDEFVAGPRIFIQLRRSRTMDKNEKGLLQRQKIASILGDEIAAKLVVQETKVIPEVVDTVYSIDEGEWKKLTTDEQYVVLDALGNTPSVCLFREVPERVKKGEPRKN